MHLGDYQERAVTTAIFPREPVCAELDASIYPFLGLAAETGEVLGKLKKAMRDGEPDRTAMVLELGDVLWYLAVCANELGMTLEEVAARNLEKLADRASRHALRGSGDHR